MTTQTQTRLERWAPGRLAEIAQDYDAAHARLRDAVWDRPAVLSVAMEMERLNFEAALIRTLVSRRDVGVASIYQDLRPMVSGHRDHIDLSRIKAEATLAFLALHGDMLTDEELRRAVCGPTALPYRG